MYQLAYNLKDYDTNLFQNQSYKYQTVLFLKKSKVEYWLLSMFTSSPTTAIRVSLRWRMRALRWVSWMFIHAWYGSHICVTWLMNMCDMTHEYVWHDSWICVTWFPYIPLTYESAAVKVLNIYTRVTWLICMRDMAHEYVWQDSWILHWRMRAYESAAVRVLNTLMRITYVNVNIWSHITLIYDLHICCSHVIFKTLTAALSYALIRRITYNIHT